MPSYKPQRQFRCDDELYLKVKAIASKEFRSVNQQIILVLTNYIADYERANGTIEIDTDALYE